MATNIDPAMVPLLPEEMGDEPMVEIEIEDPESVKIGIDGLEIELEPGRETAEDFDANLAEYMDEGDLQGLASDLIGLVDADISRT
jgi:hypothetical protein